MSCVCYERVHKLLRLKSAENCPLHTRKCAKIAHTHSLPSRLQEYDNYKSVDRFNARHVEEIQKVGMTYLKAFREYTVPHLVYYVVATSSTIRFPPFQRSNAPLFITFPPTDFKPIDQPNKHPIMRFSTASSSLFTAIASSAALRPYLAAASVSAAAPDDAQASEHVTDGKCTCNICQL